MTNETASNRIYFVSSSDFRVGTLKYYEEAMSAEFYGVAEDGRAFKS